MRRSVGLAVLVVVALAACGGTAIPTTTDPPSGTTAPTAPTVTGLVIESVDGSAALEIPADALPAGVDPDSITIEPTEADLAHPGVSALLDAGFDLAGSYRLSPEDLVFEQPVVLRVLSQEAGRLLAAFTVDDDGLEPLEVDDQAIGEEAGMGFAVPHFSQVSTFFGPFFAFLEAPDQAVVDMPFAVRSQVMEAVPFAQALPGPKFTFSLSGSLLATLPVVPNLTAAPALTAGLASFTGVSTLTCAEEGTSKIAHTVLASVPRSDLIAYGIEITTGSGADVHLAGMLSLIVECVPPTVETPEIQVSGIYEGALQLTAVTGLPGPDYSDTYELILQECGLLTLTQRATQESTGRFFYMRVGYEVEPADSNFFYAHAHGTGSDYGEAYTFDIAPRRDGTIDVSGVAVGGGHGFGEILPEDTLWYYAYIYEKSPDPARFEGAGWVNAVEGKLTRTGDAPPCD